MPEPLELDDIQRLLIDGLSRWPASRYVLIRVHDGCAADARLWLNRCRPDVATARERSGRDEASDKPRVAVAFTAAGLEALGLTSAVGFLAEFREGMTTVPRRTDLGDPDALDWGCDSRSIHVLLMVFSRSEERREDDWRAYQPGGWATVVECFDTFVRKGGFEHFGYKDGISQPRIEGTESSRQTSAAETAANTLKPGEFILGYPNEAAVLPTSPTVPAALDPYDLLRTVPSREDLRKDFGRNGTYLVLRQFAQHVEAFNAFLASAGADAERVAAKLVGRWRTGAPLVKAPETDRKALATDNDFTYYETDPDGHACPLGAHIRRANPRDSMVNEDLGIGPDLAAQEIRRHRIIRRGRLYEQGNEKGLFFLCLNANIQDQFEFVQHQWLNSPRFAGLDGEVDPLVGRRCGAPNRMTLQAAGGSCQVELPRFIELRGGAYFFLPGLRALAFLAGLK
jgi:Dyp-type peroxidase family